MNKFKTLIEDISWLYFTHDLCEMANLQPEETGLKHTIHIGVDCRGKHGPRVKVSNVPGKWSVNDNFTVTAEDEPRVVGNCKIKQEHLDDVKDWVKLNRDHLHKIWREYETIPGKDVLSQLKPLR